MTELNVTPPCFGIALCSGDSEESRDKGRDQAWKKKQFWGGRFGDDDTIPLPQ